MKLLAAPLRGLKQLGQMVFGNSGTFGRLLLPQSVRHYQQLVGDGTSASVVMAPLLWIARNFPEAPPAIWRLLDDGEEERDAKHALIRLLARPNPYYSGATLWMATLIDWHATGNAYWIKIRNRNGLGVPTQLWWVPASLIDPIGDKDNFISHYEYRPGTGTVRLDPSEVVHFRYGLDPDDPRYGRSPLSTVLREIFSDTEAAAFTSALLHNMGIPGLLVSPESSDSPPSPDDVKAVKEYIDDEFTGDGRGKPLVMSGPTKVQQFGFNPQQLDLRSLRKVPEERVTAVLGVPAVVAGLGAGLDRSTFANYREARAAAFQDVIIPAQRLLAEDLRFQLLSDFETDPWQWRVGFDLSGVQVLQEDRDKLFARTNQAVTAGWMTVAEARRAVDLEPGPGDDIYLRPFSALEVPAGQERPIVERAPETSQRKNRAAAIAQAGLVRALDTAGRKLADDFAVDLEQDFDQLGAMAAKAFRDLDPDLGKGRKALSDDAIAAQVIERMSLDEWDKGRLRATFEGHYRRSVESTVATINQVLDLGVQLRDETMRAVIHAGGTRRGMLDIRRETRDAIIRAIAAGREDGVGAIEIARRIRDEVPAGRFIHAGPKYRAELIARAETKHSQNAGSIAAYRDAENITQVVAFDARIGDIHDPECIARDGRTFSLADAERQELTHPNCSLSWGPVIADPLE